MSSANFETGILPAVSWVESELEEWRAKLQGRSIDSCQVTGEDKYEPKVGVGEGVIQKLVQKLLRHTFMKC